MSTLKIEHISHLDNGTPDLSIDSSGHLNIVNGNLQMGGVTMLDTNVGAPLPLAGGAMTGELIIADTGTLDIRMGTDKRVTWSGTLGEIGSVAGFQATNTAGSALGSFGMRGTDLRFATGSAERLRITDNAVGIGTDSPGTSASGYNSGALHLHQSSSGGGSQLRLTNVETGVGTSDGFIISKWSNKKTYFTNFDDGADTIFTQSNSSGTLVTTLVLDGDGNVGINNTNPSQRLTVNSPGGSGAGAAGKYSEVMAQIYETGGQSEAGRRSIMFFNDVNNWYNGTEKTVFGMAFNNNGAIRGGIQYDHKNTERMTIWSGYGPIEFKVPSATASGDYRADQAQLTPLTIKSVTGNVGIGTVSPARPLNIVNDAGANPIQSIRNSNTAWSQYALTRYGTEGEDVRYMDFGYYRGTSEVNRGLVIKSQANTNLVHFLDSGKVGIKTEPIGSFNVVGTSTIYNAYADPDLTVVNGNGHSSAPSGEITMVHCFQGTGAANDLFEFQYDAASWKSFGFEIDVSTATGWGKVCGGGYNNGGPSGSYNITGSKITAFAFDNVSGNSQAHILRCTFGGGVHHTVRVKYWQGGGDGGPRADRATMRFIS